MGDLGSTIHTIDGTRCKDQTEPPDMMTRPILTAFCVTVAIFSSAGSYAHGPGEIVKPNFEQAIPNLPGKSLVAVEVEYAVFQQSLLLFE